MNFDFYNPFLKPSDDWFGGDARVNWTRPPNQIENFHGSRSSSLNAMNFDFYNPQLEEEEQYRQVHRLTPPKKKKESHPAGTC